MAPAGALLLGYLLGAIPFGVLLTRAFGAGDLRRIGSGAVIVAERIMPGGAILGAIGGFIGHLYPVWLGFRGGKGVATLFGIVLALHWPSGLIYAGVWLGALAGLRTSSIAGMAAAISAPLALAWFGEFDFVLPLIAMALLVWWQHRENLERLLAGSEPRIGDPPAAAVAEPLHDRVVDGIG